MDRRRFFGALGAALALPRDVALGAAPRSSLWLAYTSFAVRLRYGRDTKGTTPPFGPEALAEMCRRVGSTGAQLDFGQLQAGSDAIDRAAAAYRDRQLGLEVSMPSRALESPEAYAEAVAIARALGARCARVALLSGRRYETFETAAAWQGFASRWREMLLRMRPEFERHRFHVGIENHKDWLAPELVSLLRAIDSPYVGACVDFGNNLALLEDPDDTIAQLAPFAVTTHVKDMAVRVTREGFELSEVPLGQGLLPLARYVGMIGKARPDARFCLEMMTRDPLVVPFRTDRYWAPFEAASRAPARLRAFEDRVLARATRDLPRVTGLAPERQLALEVDNVAACVAHARDVLHLEAPDA
ncbi:hypothetical protein TBR22_A13360 [Luteitalea sp. TBR-22]|uniref:sugar phosphate isomerase/epimerase family protein n=1 Tax=Luteitalea sp. TBR-22 TaxID=2802971 RepID=UPI001AF1534B|nr:TIM barrel protein [Luteitalea sp. TBR-22]BCS32127.1 hypothetical protein TBR22_A13360 [Luteitalea sp. TBR-22]